MGWETMMELGRTMLAWLRRKRKAAKRQQVEAGGAIAESKSGGAKASSVTGDMGVTLDGVVVIAEPGSNVTINVVGGNLQGMEKTKEEAGDD